MTPKNNAVETPKVESMTIRLLGTSPSNWIKEGTENSPNPERMEGPRLFNIIPDSKYLEVDSEGVLRNVYIRYIPGVDTILVSEQEARKIVPKANISRQIWLKPSNMTIFRIGSSIPIYDFLKLNEGNTSNKKRPPGADDMFEEIVASDIAELKLVGFDKKLEAMQMVAELRRVEEGVMVYNVEQLNLAANFFNIAFMDEPNEIFAALAQLAEDQPAKIMSCLGDAKRKLAATILKAEQLNVLIFEDERVINAETKAVVHSFGKKLARQKAQKALADFYLTDEGKDMYQQLIRTVEIAHQRKLTAGGVTT